MTKRLNVKRIATLMLVVLMFTCVSTVRAEAASPKKEITAITFKVDKSYVGFPTIKLSNTPGVKAGKVSWSCTYAELSGKKAGAKIVVSIPVKAKKGYKFLHTTQGYIDGPTGSSVKYYWQNASNGLIKITVRVHKKLSTPRLTTNAKNVSWSSVSNADSYTVTVFDAVSDAKIYSSKLSKKATKITFSAIRKKITASQAERPVYITLRANGSGYYVKSDTSHRSASFFVEDTSVNETRPSDTSEYTGTVKTTPSSKWILASSKPGSKKQVEITLTDDLDSFQEHIWRISGNDYYLFDGKNYVTGAIKSIKNRWYYFDPTTKKLTVGWIYISGKYYYASPFTGALVFNTWIKTNTNDFYYIHSNGTMAISTYVNGEYVGADGKWDPTK